MSKGRRIAFKSQNGQTFTFNQIYRKVRQAIKDGVLVRPDICERCGEKSNNAHDGRSLIQAHHHDYSKPLDVEWICVDCHRKETPVAHGERNGASKLCEADILNIRKMRQDGMLLMDIAEHFSVDKATISRVASGKLWPHVAATNRSQP